MRSLMLLCALTLSGAPGVAEDKKPGKRYALLIGVQAYESADLNDLSCSDKDVHDLADALKSNGYKASDIAVLSTREKGKAPTAKRIRDAIKEFAGRDYAETDMVLIAFSGHGVQIGDKNYFCPAGASLPGNDAKPEDCKGLVSISDLYEQLKECKAGSRLILTDCCRNDPARGARKIREVNRKALGKEMPDEVTLIMSCGPGQKAYEDKDLGRGVFFHFVIEGLKGSADQNQDGMVTRAELEEYVRGAMRKHKSKQTPQIITKATNDPPVSVLGGGGLPVLKPAARIVREAFVYRNPALTINFNAKFAASCDGEGLQLFDLERRRRVASTSTAANPWSPALFLKSGAVLAGGNSSALLLNPLTGKATSTINLKLSPLLAGTTRDEKRTWLASNADLAVLDIRGNPVESFNVGGEKVKAACLVGSGEQLVIGTDKGKLFVYDVDKGKQLHELEGHEQQILAIWASKDGSKATTLDAIGRLIRWDLDKGKKTDESDVRLGTDTVWSAAFQADGKRCILGCLNGQVGMVDIPAKEKAKLIATYDKHAKAGGAVAVAMAADGSRAVSVSGTELWIYEMPME